MQIDRGNILSARTGNLYAVRIFEICVSFQIVKCTGCDVKLGCRLSDLQAWLRADIHMIKSDSIWDIAVFSESTSRVSVYGPQTIVQDCDGGPVDHQAAPHEHGSVAAELRPADVVLLLCLGRRFDHRGEEGTLCGSLHRLRQGCNGNFVQTSLCFVMQAVACALYTLC